jgi:uncharacterized membrane protein
MNNKLIRKANMKGRTFRVSSALIVAALAAAIGWSIVAGNFIVAIVAVVLALGANFLLRRANKEVRQDERTTLLYEKAAGATIRLALPITAVASLILLALQDRVSDDVTLVAYVLAYATCILLLLHLGFYSYYSRKH